MCSHAPHCNIHPSAVLQSVARQLCQWHSGCHAFLLTDGCAWCVCMRACVLGLMRVGGGLPKFSWCIPLLADHGETSNITSSIHKTQDHRKLPFPLSLDHDEPTTNTTDHLRQLRRNKEPNSQCDSSSPDKERVREFRFENKHSGFRGLCNRHDERR